MRRRKRNPMAKKFSISGMRNWLILGGALVGGYFAYTKFIAPMLVAEKLDRPAGGAPVPSASAPPPGAAPAPDLAGPAVKRGVLVSTRSTICIADKTPGMMYAKITKTDANGYQQFKPSVNGRFTRRLLCKGKNRWAEIKAS